MLEVPAGSASHVEGKHYVKDGEELQFYTTGFVSDSGRVGLDVRYVADKWDFGVGTQQTTFPVPWCRTLLLKTSQL